MAQAPAHLPPSFPPSSPASVSTPTTAAQHSVSAPTVDPQQEPAVLSYRLPLRFRVEFSFDTLFDGKGDRLETVGEWLKWLPPLAATLQQLSLADIPDEARHDRALQAIRADADVCASDPRYGRTVLHWACLLAQPSLVGLLLQHGAGGASLDQPDAQGRSPLGCVASLRIAPGSAEVVGLLLSAGASPTALPNRGAELLYLADLDAALTQRLLRAGVPVDGDARLASTPLLAACSHELWAVAAVLLDAGAQLRPGGPLRMSALHHADMPVWLAEQLHRRGADVNARNLLAETPLMLACAAGNVPLARWLIDAGASTDAVCDEGLRAIDHATRHRDASSAGCGLHPSTRRPPTDG